MAAAKKPESTHIQFTTHGGRYTITVPKASLILVAHPNGDKFAISGTGDYPVTNETYDELVEALI